jgi:hypothetical protein
MGAGRFPRSPDDEIRVTEDLDPYWRQLPSLTPGNFCREGQGLTSQAAGTAGQPRTRPASPRCPRSTQGSPALAAAAFALASPARDRRACCGPRPPVIFGPS